MKKNIVLALTCIFTTSFVSAEFSVMQHKKILLGTMQFSKLNMPAESVRVWHRGTKLTGQIKPKAHKILFDIPVSPNEKQFYVLVTEPKNIKEMTTEANTVDHYRLTETSSYKLYALRLHKVASKDVGAPKKNASPEYAWDIEEHVLTDASKKIPENTIIVCYNQEFIDRIEGGDELRLPTLFIKDSVLATESHEASVKCLLASLNFDALHVPVRTEVKHDQKLCNIVTIVS